MPRMGMYKVTEGKGGEINENIVDKSEVIEDIFDKNFLN